MLIKCTDLVVGYADKAVTKELNFQVDEGDYFCIIGENGSGKSTLFKSLLGLIPCLSGQIYFPDRSKGLGYLPQQMDLQSDFPATVEEIVLSGNLGRMGLRPFYRQEERARARSAMNRLNIENIASSSYSRLSGGQKQRVLLARALCAMDKILFLDEPVAGLDGKVSMELYDIIHNLNLEGVTILMVSHDLDAVKKYANRILELDSDGASRLINFHMAGEKEAFKKLIADQEGESFAKRGGDND